MSKPGVLRKSGEVYVGHLSDGKRFEARRAMAGPTQQWRLFEADGTRVRMLNSSLGACRAYLKCAQDDLEDPRSLADLLGDYLALEEDLGSDPFAGAVFLP
jgi:hypothetical protein